MRKLIPVIIQLLAFAIAVPSVAQNTWTWQNPLPTGSTLRGVTFFDNNTGVVVGENGVVGRTLNGGKTWTVFGAGTSANFYHAAFADDAVCVAVGDSGIMLRSTNTGGSWTRTASGSSSRLSGIAFASPSVGVAVGNGGTIIRTADAGATWAAIASGTTHQFLAVSFGDADSGIAVGASGTVLRTTDAGAHWKDVSVVARNLNAVVMSDPDDGFMVGDLGYNAYTIDGGRTWTAQPQIPSTDLYGLTLIAGLDIIASGSGGLVDHSSDQGATWTSVGGTPITAGGASYTGIVYAVTFPDFLIGYVAGEGGMLLRTTNNGSPWLSAQSGTNADLDDIMYLDANNGVACGNGIVLHTSDQGKHWQSVASGAYHYFIGCSRVDNTTGYVTGTEENSWPPDIAIVKRTTDGGATWKDVAFADTNWNVVEHGTFLDANTGTVVGAMATFSGIDTNLNVNIAVWNTTNGGTSWKQQYLGNGHGILRDVAHADGTTEVAVGDSGTILRTANGGATWQLVSSPTSATLPCVASPTAGVFLAGDIIGRIFRSGDGGATWTKVSSGLASSVMSIRFSTTQNGMAACRGNSVLATNDGGLTWSAIACPATGGVDGVYLGDTANADFVGTGGKILHLRRSTGGGVTNKPAFAASPASLDFDTLLVNTSRSQSITVRNTGTDSLIVSSIASTNSVFTVSPASARIAKGDSVHVVVKFASTATGVRTGRVVFTHNAANGSDTVAVRAVAVRRALTFATPLLDCGAVRADSSVSATVWVYNTSDAILTISNITFDLPEFSTPRRGLGIAKGDSVAIKVTFAPTVSGASVYRAQMVFQHDGFLRADTMDVRGTSLNGALQWSRSYLDFGDVPVGDSRTQSVVITNTGNAAVAITRASVLPDSSHFAWSPRSANVAPGASVRFDVTFTALDTVTQAANLMFFSGGTSDGVMLSGRGVPVDLSYSRRTLDFGRVTRGQHSAVTFTITNRTLNAVTITGIHSPDAHFAATPNAPTIAAGDSATIQVTFTADETAAYSAPLVITHNLPTSPDTVMLTAVGIPSGVNEPTMFDVIALRNHPNPFAATTTFTFTLPNDAGAVLHVCDLLGREIATVSSARGTGEHTAVWRADGIPAGMYVARLTTGGSVVSRVVRIVR